MQNAAEAPYLTQDMPKHLRTFHLTFPTPRMAAGLCATTTSLGYLGDTVALSLPEFQHILPRRLNPGSHTQDLWLSKWPLQGEALAGCDGLRNPQQFIVI